MSQRPQYICDGCEKPIGNKPHLSLVLQNTMACGVARPPGTFNAQKRWSVHDFSTKNFVHFHNGKCIGTWADTEIALAVW